jgi:integrase
MVDTLSPLRAMREELLMRNVARLVELPGWDRQPIVPWTAEEARGFLAAAHDDPLYPAFVLLLLYGLRRGEVLGLRWIDVDLGGGEIRVRHEAQAANREELGRAWQDNGLVFTTRTGRPVEPRNFVRSFRRICAASGIRAIKLHHLRHTTATLLKNLGVPARDAQLILGHSRLAVTQEIYTHEDQQAQHDALTKISQTLRDDRLTAP